MIIVLCVQFKPRGLSAIYYVTVQRIQTIVLMRSFSFNPETELETQRNRNVNAVNNHLYVLDWTER